MSAVRTPSKLEMQAKRREIIRLRYEGNTLARTAELVGLAGPSSVQHHENAWLAERTPSTEVTEARRQMQLEGIDEVRRRLFEMLTEPEPAVRLAVVDRIDKLWSREARLLGLDLAKETGGSLTVNVFTREWLAEQVFAPLDVVEGIEAVEVTDG